MKINVHFYHISLLRMKNLSDRSCRGSRNTYFVFIFF